MLANNTKRSLLKVLATGLLSAIITFAAVTMNISAEIGTCLYVEQLAADPTLSAAYTASIKDAGNMNSGAEIDSFSTSCLACHNGMMATKFNLRVKNNPYDRVIGLENIIGGHPVGMVYENYAAANEREYRDEARFSTEMIFAEGKIGCLTCHNPLNTAKGHLVMSNEGSGLCFACHKK